MKFPSDLSPYFQNIENNELTDLNEWALCSNMVSFIQQQQINVTPEVSAEIMAFQFMENHSSKPSVWGTYFQPFTYFKDADDNVTQMPDPTTIDENIIDYWFSRAKEDMHPVLKARYSGIVCDFYEMALNRRLPFDIAKICIESLIATYKLRIVDSPVFARSNMKRALQLALKFNQQPLIDQIKNLILSNDQMIAVDNDKNIWTSSFDLLLNRKPTLVTAEEEASIINLLEARLEGLYKIDPWASKAVAERLAEYYSKNEKRTDIKRVMDKLGEAYEKHIGKVPAIQVAGHLQELMKTYRYFQLNEQAEQLMVRIRAAGKNADEEFKKISVSHDFDTKKLVKYAEKILKYDGDILFARIIKSQQLTKSELADDLKKTVELHGIRYYVTTSIVDKKGRILAKIDPLNEDKKGGHLVNHYYRLLQMDAAVHLHFVFEVGIRDGKLTVETVMDFLKRSCIIEVSRHVVVEAGIKAYFDKNYLVCIHLLIPQFEEALRNLLEANQGNIMNFNDDIYPVKTFNPVLDDPIISKAFGEDLVYYFKMLFVDPRGWNLRNQVSHGLLEPELFNQQTAQRLLHAFFCLGMIRWQDAPLKA
jgi:hypothetical protein